MHQDHNIGSGNSDEKEMVNDLRATHLKIIQFADTMSGGNNQPQEKQHERNDDRVVEISIKDEKMDQTDAQQMSSSFEYDSEVEENIPGFDPTVNSDDIVFRSCEFKRFERSPSP